MNASIAQTDSLYLGHFDLILASMPLATLGLRWKKSQLDPARYELDGVANGQSYSVWKSGSSWGTLSGGTAPTLKQGKELEELRLKANIMAELEGLEVYLRAFDVHSRAVLAVKGEQVEDQSRYCLSKVAYRALDALLSELLTSRLEVVLKRFPEIASQRTASVLASALVGFDMDDLKLMFVGPHITFSWSREGPKNYALKGNSISIPVSTLVNSSDVMKDHPGFCDYPSLQVTQLAEKPLIRQLDHYIEQTFRVAQAVAG